MNTLDLVTMGEAMVLLLADDGSPLEHTTRLRRSVAGAEANVAIGLARLGHRTGYLGRIGDDALGRAVLRTLRGEGIDISRLKTDPLAPTGLLLRDQHPTRPADVAYYRAGSAASRLEPSDVDSAWIASGRILHVTGITAALSESCRDAIQTALAAAATAGNIISFDPNVRHKLATSQSWPELLRPIACEASIILAGLDEAELITGREGPQDCAAWFLDHGAQQVVFKDGARGAWATDGNQELRQAALPTQVADPIGAGDAFAAGYLSAVLHGLPIEIALRQAAAIAAAVVSTPGDIDGLPRPEQRDAIISGAGTYR